MNKLLHADNITSDGGKSSWNQLVRTIKEKTCFVALDPEAAKEKAANSNDLKKDYELPDGSVV